MAGTLSACCIAVAADSPENHDVARQTALEERSAGEPTTGEQKSRLAALVRVHLPLIGSGDEAIRRSIERACDHLLDESRHRDDLRRPVLVLQLEPPAGALEASSSFERAFALARALCSSDLAGVRKVAFAPQGIQGHATLLAMACEELIMAPEAEIGDAGIGEPDQGAILQTVVAAYREIAQARRTIPESLAVGMIDPASEVLQVETEDGIHFVLGTELDKFSKTHEIIQRQTLVPPGTSARFTGREGRQFGFVKHLAGDRRALASALGVPFESLREDSSWRADWNAILLEIEGPITGALASQIDTMIGNELGRSKVNWIGLRIDSSGGDLEASIRLATMLARLDPNSVRTVAYVPVEATGPAAVVALACDQLFLHSNGRLLAVESGDSDRRDKTIAPDNGGPGNGVLGKKLPRRQLPPARPLADAASIEAAKTAIRDWLAPRSGRECSLLAAMIDPSLEVFKYRNKTTGEERLFSSEEVNLLADAADWHRGKQLTEPGKRLVITGKQALELGIVDEPVDSFDQLKQRYGMVQDPRLVKPNWALNLVEALASPTFSSLLLMAGFAGIYFEVRAPGIGVGAFVATVAFLLFFWSKGLYGTAGWLEVLLFLGGVSCILLEIFVLPGFGIFGLGGGAMVIASLVLASQTFILPQTGGEMRELRNSMVVVAMASIGVMALSLVARRLLPHVPFYSRMVLAPPDKQQRTAIEESEAMADYTHLIGMSGEAKTDLMPTGKALVGHDLLDVIAQSEPIDRGTPIQVVSAQANRVIVRVCQSHECFVSIQNSR